MNMYSKIEAKQIREKNAAQEIRKINAKTLTRRRIEEFKIAKDLFITVDELNQNRMNSHAS